jgi:putative lipoic acid-binding regulatory protein
MSLPSVEVLEAHHDFPGQYTFKVIGSAKDNFLARVVSAVRDELQLEVDPEYSIRSTKKGNHIAITLEPHCESAQRVLAIYSRLTGMDGVVILL